MGQEADEQGADGVHQEVALPTPPTTLIQLRQGSARCVTDPDEETFLLYSLSQPERLRSGLGFVNASSDVLRVTVALFSTNGDAKCIVEPADDDEDASTSASYVYSRKPSRVGSSTARTRARARLGSVRHSSLRESPDDVVVTVRQSITSLRSTAGDTGSVVWRSSLSLASTLLHQLSPRSTSLVPPILQPSMLRKARVLELGAGTGILPLLLLSHPELLAPDASMTWLATDQAAMLPLLRRNLYAHPLSITSDLRRSTSCGEVAGAMVGVAELDWLDAQEVWQSGVESRRQRFRNAVLSVFEQRDSSCRIGASTSATIDDVWPDLILATDCIYNPSLFTALLATMDLVSLPNRTVALIVCELRSAESVRLWLSDWLARGWKEEKAAVQNGKWCVCSLEEGMLGHTLAEGNAAWIAWRVE